MEFKTFFLLNIFVFLHLTDNMQIKIYLKNILLTNVYEFIVSLYFVIVFKLFSDRVQLLF